MSVPVDSEVANQCGYVGRFRGRRSVCLHRQIPMSQVSVVTSPDSEVIDQCVYTGRLRGRRSVCFHRQILTSDRCGYVGRFRGRGSVCLCR